MPDAFQTGMACCCLTSRKMLIITSRRGHFYTCQLFKEFFEVLEVFGGAFFTHVLAEKALEKSCSNI